MTSVLVNKIFTDGNFQGFSNRELVEIITGLKLDQKNISKKLQDLYMQYEEIRMQPLGIYDLIKLLDTKMVDDIFSFIDRFGLDKDRSISNKLRNIYIKSEVIRFKTLSLDAQFELLASPIQIASIKEYILGQYKNYISSTDGIIFPEFVHGDLAQEIIQKKCQKEQAFLDSQGKELLQEMAKDFGLENYLSLSKNQLCLAISDINNIARSKTNKGLTQCFKGLMDLEYQEKHAKSDNNSIPDVKKEEVALKAEMEKLKVLLDNWRSLDVYKLYDQCNGKIGEECQDVFVALHSFSERIKKQTKTCNKMISQLSRKLKIGDLDKNASLFSKFKAHFF